MVDKYKVKREVTRTECPWLHENINEDTIVYRCVQWTYGCIGPNGIAVTLDKDGGYPFFELPYLALEKIY
jgi:hypothetical protein